MSGLFFNARGLGEKEKEISLGKISMDLNYILSAFKK
jgi:hypothetical protein